MTRAIRNLVLAMSLPELVLWADLGGEIPVGKLGIIAAERQRAAERKPVKEQKRRRLNEYCKRQLWPVHKRHKRRKAAPFRLRLAA